MHPFFYMFSLFLVTVFDIFERILEFLFHLCSGLAGKIHILYEYIAERFILFFTDLFHDRSKLLELI